MFISGHNRWSSNTVLKSQWSWHWARNLIWIVCRGEGFLDVSVVAMRVFFSNRYMPFWMWTGEQWRANTDFWTFSKHEAKVIYFLYIYWSNECHFKRPIQSVLNHWGLAILYSILTELQIIIYIFAYYITTIISPIPIQYCSVYAALSNYFCISLFDGNLKETAKDHAEFHAETFVKSCIKARGAGELFSGILLVTGKAEMMMPTNIFNMLKKIGG